MYIILQPQSSVHTRFFFFKQYKTFPKNIGKVQQQITKMANTQQQISKMANVHQHKEEQWQQQQRNNSACNFNG